MAGRPDLLRAFSILSGSVSFELGRLDMAPGYYSAQQCADMKARLEKALARALAVMEGQEDPK